MSLHSHITRAQGFFLLTNYHQVIYSLFKASLSLKRDKTNNNLNDLLQTCLIRVLVLKIMVIV